MKLSAKALGLALGIICAISIFLMTVLAAYTDYLKHWAELFLGVYPYYGITLQGAVAGLIWGFFDGFIFGVVLAWIYNAFAPGRAS